MVKVGDTLRIICMDGEPHYTGRVGMVTRINEDCYHQTQIHGTWGGCCLYEEQDEYEVIEQGKETR